MESNESAQTEFVTFFKTLCDENRLKRVGCWHSTFVRARSARVGCLWSLDAKKFWQALVQKAPSIPS